MLIGCDVSAALGLLSPNQGALRQILDRQGIREELETAFFICAALLAAGLVKPRLRAISLTANFLLSVSAWVILLFFSPNVLFAPFGNVLAICAIASLWLLWLGERESNRGGGKPSVQ
jgi:hypothetical protein